MKLPHNFDYLNLRYLYTSHNFLDIPELPTQSFRFSPDDIFPIPFSAPHSHIQDNNLLHFYIDDYRFERFWRNPDRYLENLSIAKYVISPDFSLFLGMPYALQIFNVYRNRLLSLLMTEWGMKVIYNLRWSDPDSFFFCFDGIPKDSVISLKLSKTDEFFHKGFHFILDNLSPSYIIFFGEPSFLAPDFDVPFFVYPACHFS